MKRVTSVFLLLLLLCRLLPVPGVQAAKVQESRAIAIVFDNSGSMYVNNQQAWCRATYAMEVFASMLNPGDTLRVYPMNPITVDGREYTMDSPLYIDSAVEAGQIRKIYTDFASGTPIESIDAAAAGLAQEDADHKYLIVLTDGASFYRNDIELSAAQTQTALTEALGQYSASGMDVLYLGIGSHVAMPTNPPSSNFIKEKTSDSAGVLSTLTRMCNRIFGRDTLPSSHIQGDQVDFDISMKRLIVLVQGENVSDVSLISSDGEVGTKESVSQVQYSTNGYGNYTSVPDTSLQGMMVTYSNCAPGTYTLHYSGQATNVEIYYEPDADMVVEFLAPDGSVASADALYDGEYTVRFGMQDAQTGKLVSSDLLGDITYTGSYQVNDEPFSINCHEPTGAQPVVLSVGDSFNASLTVTYLSGYTITKTSCDLGWPEGGLTVVPRPAGELRLEITPGDPIYYIPTLTEGTPAQARVTYEGQLLTGDALKAVEITWDPDASGALLEKDYQQDHYDIVFSHKNPQAPQETPLGTFSFPMIAYYTPSGSQEAVSQPVEFTYAIEDPIGTLHISLESTQDYYQRSALDDAAPILVRFTYNGEPLTAADMERLTLRVDTEGLPHTLTACPEESAYQITLQDADGLLSGSYRISCDAALTDEIGRAITSTDSTEITLGLLPLWARWAIFLGLALLLLLIILIILHIKALPKGLHARKADCRVTYDGEDVSRNAGVDAKMDKKRFKVTTRFGGRNVGLQMDVRPSQDSYIKTPQTKRKADVSPRSVRKIGNATITEATIGNMRYVLNDETHNLERVPPNEKPFPIRHGSTVAYSGVIQDGGQEKFFSVTTKLSAKKK